MGAKWTRNGHAQSGLDAAALQRAAHAMHSTAGKASSEMRWRNGKSASLQQRSLLLACRVLTAP
jgi:hypothetical protein